MRIELNGSEGSLAFDFEAMNELSLFDATGPARDAGFRRVSVTNLSGGIAAIHHGWAI